ncbi:hypothetical protein PMAYCL1PPCAC_11531, partial [Pristionchus mayeri]
LSAGLMFRTPRVLSRYRAWNARATDWLMDTKWGKRARLGLLAATVVGYPSMAILWNGPMVKYTFPLRHSYEQLTPRLEEIVKKEYDHFLEKNSRLPKEAPHRYHLLKTTDEIDTVAKGSLGVRSGAEFALPFYLQFKTVEEALEYFKTHYPKALPYLGAQVPVVWDSDVGRELVETFVMSDKAARFVVQRDFYAHDGWAAIAQRSITFATFATFSSLFTYWLHMGARIFGTTAVSFAGIYAVCTTLAWAGNTEWDKTYRYMTDVYADSISSRTSTDHCDGGKEYYWNILKRNRLILDIHPPLYTKIKMTGDIRGLTLPLFIRYDHLKDRTDEDDDFREVIEMDD